MFRVKVCSIIENQILAITSIISLFAQLVAPCSPRYFDLFVEDEKVVLAFGTKRARMEDVQDPFIQFDQAMRWASHDSRVSRVVDEVY